MQVVVKGKNIAVPEHIKAEATAKLLKVRKLFDRFIDMEVVFSEDKNPRIAERVHCEVVLHAKGRYLRAEGRGTDLLNAVDDAEAKLTRQVRKLKTKVTARRHSNATPPGESISAADFAEIQAQIDERV